MCLLVCKYKFKISKKQKAMKIKLLVTVLFLTGFQNFYAQEIKPAVVDSVRTTVVDLEKQKADQKAELDRQLKEDKKALKQQEKIESERKSAEKKLQKEQDKLKKEQKKFQKEQSKLASAEKSLAKNRSKLASAQKDLGKMQAKHSKALEKGKLSPVDVEKGNLKITKQQLKIKKIEEDIDNSQKKLDKLR